MQNNAKKQHKYNVNKARRQIESKVQNIATVFG